MSQQQETIAIDPATGKEIGRWAVDSVEEVEAMVARARAAQPGWAATPVRERVRAILRVRDYVVAGAERLAEVIHRDNGKTRLDALATEVLPAALAATYYAKKARSFSVCWGCRLEIDH